MSRTFPSPELRFWAKVVKSRGCWLFTGATSGKYRSLTVYGKNMKAHRFSWELHFGKIPAGLQVLHRCDNTQCVKPSHLFLGTQIDNMQDCIAKGRRGDQAGERHGLSKLTAKDVAEMRSLHRSGVTAADLGRKYGVSKSSAWAAVTGKTWRTK